MVKLTREQKERIYRGVMESLQTILMQHLNELKNSTVKSASDLASKRMNKLLRRDPITDEYIIDKEEFIKYLKTVENPAQRKRLIKLYNNGTLVNKLISQVHMLSTVANSDLEWFRENTDISLSPEFFQSSDKNDNGEFKAIGNDVEGWGSKYKTSQRKPTKEEHDFYRFFTSMGTDTDGMTIENIKKYRKALYDFYMATFGINIFAM